MSAFWLSYSMDFCVIKFLVSAHFLHGCPPLQEILCAIFNLHFLPLTGSSFISKAGEEDSMRDKTLAPAPVQKRLRGRKEEAKKDS